MGEFGHERLAKLRATAAAVLGQIEHQLTHRVEVRALDHLPSTFLRDNESHADEDREVAGKGALAKA
jgi:hypothetical protein